MVVLSCPFLNHTHSLAPCSNPKVQHPIIIQPRLLTNSSWRLSCRFNTRGAIYANATGPGVPSAAFVDVRHPESSAAPTSPEHSEPHLRLDDSPVDSLLPQVQQPKTTRPRGRPKKQQTPAINTDQLQVDRSNSPNPNLSMLFEPASSLSSLPQQLPGTEPAHPIESSSSETEQPEQHEGFSPTVLPHPSSSNDASQQTPKTASTIHLFPLKATGSWRDNLTPSGTDSSDSCSSSSTREDLFSQLLKESNDDINQAQSDTDGKFQQQRQAGSVTASGSAKVASKRGPRPTIYGISTGSSSSSSTMGTSSTQRRSSTSSSRTTASTTNSQHGGDSEDEDDTASSSNPSASSSDLRPSFTSSVLDMYRSADTPTTNQDPTRKDTTPQNLRTPDGRARVLISLTSTAGRSAACLAHLLREERCAVVQCTGHQPSLLALKVLTIATGFLNQHNSSLTFIPYCDSVWDLSGVSFGVLPNYTLHVFERQILPSETSLLILMRSAQHVFEFSMHVSRTWQDKCAVVLDQAHHFADVLYTTLQQDHRQHQELLAERSSRLQQKLQAQLQLQMQQQRHGGSSAPFQDGQQQRPRGHLQKQMWRDSLQRDPRAGRHVFGMFSGGANDIPDDEVPDPQPIVVSVDLSLALTALASVSLAQRRLMLENAPFSLQVSIYRNTTAPRLDGRNGFVLVVRHSTIGLQSEPHRAPSQSAKTSPKVGASETASSSGRQPKPKSPRQSTNHSSGSSGSSSGDDDSTETPYFSRARAQPSSRAAPDQHDGQWANDGEVAEADVPLAPVQPVNSTRWECVSNDMLEHQLQNKEYVRLPRKHYKPRRGRP